MVGIWVCEPLSREQVEMFWIRCHELWASPVRIAGFLVILYRLIGWTTFVGLGVMVIFVPVNLVLMSFVMKAINAMATRTDDRVKVGLRTRHHTCLTAHRPPTSVCKASWASR